MSKTDNTTRTKLDIAGHAGIIAGMDGKQHKHGTNTSGTRRLNRHGTLISKGKGKPYLARWMVGGKLYYRTTGETDRNKALKRLDEYTRSLREDALIDVIANLQHQLEQLQARRSKAELPLDEIWQTCLPHVDNGITAATLDNYERFTRLMVDWMRRHGVRNAAGIDSRKAEEYLRTLKDTIGVVSYNCRLVLFKKLWKIISASSADVTPDAWEGCEKQKGAKHASSRRHLTDDEIKRLMDAATEDQRQLITIAIYTGLRESDCALLKWEDIDLGKRIISTVPIKTKRHNQRVTICIHDELYKLLKGLAAGGKVSGYVNQRNAEAYLSKSMARDMTQLFRRAGIKSSQLDEQGRRHVLTGFHALRHTFVCKASNAGMSLADIAQIVGHSSATMTLAYYHPTTENMRKGIDNIKLGAA